MPLYQQNEKYKNGRLNRNVQLWVGFVTLGLILPLLREVTVCSPCKILTLDFTALVVVGLLNKFL